MIHKAVFKRLIEEQFNLDEEIRREWRERQSIFQLAHKMVRLRAQNGWSQEELANRMGVTTDLVDHVEKLNHLPMDEVHKLNKQLQSIK